MPHPGEVTGGWSRAWAAVAEGVKVSLAPSYVVPAGLFQNVISLCLGTVCSEPHVQQFAG